MIDNNKIKLANLRKQINKDYIMVEIKNGVKFVIMEDFTDSIRVKK